MRALAHEHGACGALRFTPLLASISLETAGGHSAATSADVHTSNCLNITAAYRTEEILLTRLTIIVRTFCAGKFSGSCARSQCRNSCHHNDHQWVKRCGQWVETLQIFSAAITSATRMSQGIRDALSPAGHSASAGARPAHHNLVWRGQSPYPLPPLKGPSSRPLTVTAAGSASAPSH